MNGVELICFFNTFRLLGTLGKLNKTLQTNTFDHQSVLFIGNIIIITIIIIIIVLVIFGET